MRHTTAVSLLALAIATASQASAQQGGEAPADTGQVSRTQRYDAAFFAKFAPTTALDVINQVPGFQLDLGNTDTRGFGGAAGGVREPQAHVSACRQTTHATTALPRPGSLTSIAMIAPTLKTRGKITSLASLRIVSTRSPQ